MNIFITTKLEKQLKKYQDIDRYETLIQKLQQASVNELYELNSFGFKKFKGTNKVGAIDLGSDRIICMCLADYPLQNDYCFNQYYSNQDLYNTLLLFFIAKHEPFIDPDSSLSQINDSLELIEKRENQSKIHYALFKSLYLKIIEEQDVSSVDIDSELQNLVKISPKLISLISALQISDLSETIEFVEG